VERLSTKNPGQLTDRPGLGVSPAGKLMLQVTGAFAEFERSMIRQRVNAGHRCYLNWFRLHSEPTFACASPVSAHALISAESRSTPDASRLSETGGMASCSRWRMKTLH
jgi:Resolvase, N terminal domain